MIQKIFGLMIMVFAVLLVWTLVKNNNHPKKLALTDEPSKPLFQSRTESPLVKEFKNLFQNQTELVGFSENIQRITLKSRLRNPKINSAIGAALSAAAKQNGTAPYFLEVEVFDTSESTDAPASADQNQQNPTGTNLVFQFSVFEVATKNKISEFAATLPRDMAEPQAEDKKKPGEAQTSPGTK